MRHLTVDEIINYVSLAESSGDAAGICAHVNGHIRECATCLRQVQSFLRVYDAFTQLDTREDFASFVKRAAKRAAQTSVEGTEDCSR